MEAAMTKATVAIVFALACGMMPGQALAAWAVKTAVAKTDRTPTYVARVYSTNTMLTAAGIPRQAQFIVRCRAGKLDLYVSWPDNMGANFHDVHWRFDDGQMREDHWSSSEDGTGSFVREQGSFLNGLKNAKELVVAAPASQAEMEFNVSGADQVVQTATSSCAVQ